MASGRHVTAGQVLVTRAGRMSFRHIFHAISSICTSGTSAEILTRCVHASLSEARTRSVKSIAFPALGTGQMGFDIREAATILINTVVEDAAKLGGLDRIVFCLLQPDAFTSFFRQAVRRSILLEESDLREKRPPRAAAPNTPEAAALAIKAHPVGVEHSIDYGPLVTELLSHLFVPPLSAPVLHDLPQSLKEVEPAFHLAFPNFADSGFWRVIDQRFQAALLHVMCINRSNSNKDGIDRLLTRLKNGFSGRFGILIVRGTSPVRPTAAQLNAYRHDGIMTIALNDFDLAQMAQLKAIGQPAERYLEAKLSELSLLALTPPNREGHDSRAESQRIFVGYAPADAADLRRFERSLRLLEVQGLVELWNDLKVPPGVPIDATMRKYLDESDIIACLVSPDFVASEFCFSDGLRRAMERGSNGVRVVPVVLRPCEWNQTFLGSLQAVPVTSGTVVPISQWPDQDSAWLQVARQFRQMIRPDTL